MVMRCQNSAQNKSQPLFTDETPFACGDDSSFINHIKVVSCTHENTSGGVVGNREIVRESGVLAYIKRVFCARSADSKEKNPLMLRQLEKGRLLNAQSQYLQQIRSEKGKKTIPLTQKQAVLLGGLLLAGAAGGALFRLWGKPFATDGRETEKLNVSQYVGIDQSDAFSVANTSDISLDEYNHEIEIINQLIVPVINEFYLTTENARSLSYRSVTIKNRDIPNEILRVLQDESIDWRVRNEFDLIFRYAENSPDVKNIPIKRERNIRLLIKCIQLVSAFVEENEKQAINNQSYLFGKVYLGNLYNIVNHLSGYDRRAVNLFNEQLDELSGRNDTFRSSALFSVNKRIFLPKKKEIEHSTNDDVKIRSLIDCRDEREVLTASKMMRVISSSLKNPISSLLHEGKITLDYNVFGVGCVENDNFNDLSKKIESVIDSILTWIPIYSRGRLVMLIFASLLEMLSDAMDKKELSLHSVEEIESYIRNLAKDLISSVLTRHLVDNAKDEEVNAMMKNIEIKNNKLYVNIKNPERKVETTSAFNHFSDVETKGYIFFNANRQWVLKGDIKFSHIIKSTMKKSNKILKDRKNTFFLQNNSPEIYGDGIFIKNQLNTYVMVEDNLLPVLESAVTKKMYRYVVQQNDDFSPVVTRGGEWVFENKNSPSISKYISELLADRPALTENLISGDIKHQDVGPMTLARETQYDKHFNQYIKINDKYFLLKSDVSNYQYISGEYDILPLKKVDNEYVFQSQYADGIYTKFKEKLDELPTRKIEPAYYFDKTIIDVVREKPSWYKNSAHIDNASIFYGSRHLREIDGALHINGEDFLPFRNRLLKIRSRGDDTYILGDVNSDDGGLIIYKNRKSNTYFLFPERNIINDRSKNYRLRASHCISKRQILSLCNTDFYETKDISTLLKRNKDHGITIDHQSETLTPYVGINGFYKSNDGQIFYRSSEGLFFYAKEKSSNENVIVPEYFVLHGKKPNGIIDDDVELTAVSIIKDFDTKKIIVSTPVEAQETILQIDKKSSIKLLKWLEVEGKRYDVDVDSLNEIKSRLAQDNNMGDVYEIFARSSKKIVSSIKGMDPMLLKIKEKCFGEGVGVDFKSLSQINEEGASSIVYDIHNAAFKKSVKQLNEAISVISEKRHFVEYYTSYNIQIKNKNAAEFFIDSLQKKLKRMTFILDEKNNENIILLIKNKSNKADAAQDKTLTQGTILGLTDSADPLDRIFINTAIIQEGFNPSINEFRGFQQKGKYINLVTSTMLHEAVHAIGIPEDYIYINVEETGEFVSIENAIDQIKYAIMNDSMVDEKFSYLCSLYFMSNPVYKDFSLESLMKPYNLERIFQFDDYFKGLLLINNPDTVSQIITDMAKNSRALLRRASIP